MKPTWFFLAFTCLFLASCGGGGGDGGGGNDNGNPPMTSIDLIPSPPQTTTQGANISTSTSVVIGPAGGTVQLPNVASITIPPNFVLGSQPIVLSLTNDSGTAATFDVAAELYDVAFRLTYEVRINIGIAAPQAGQVALILNIPDDFLAAIPAGGSIAAFMRQESGGEEERLVEFDAVASVLDLPAKKITVHFGAEGFVLGDNGTYEAVIVVAAGPIDPSALNAVAISPGRSAVTKSGVVSTGAALAAASGSPLADGLGPPRELLLFRISPFGPRAAPAGIHKGVDLQARFQNVLAAADGFAEPRVQRTTYPAGPIAPLGYGLYYLIRHSDGSKTIYAHLNNLRVAGTVTKGQVIGTSGESGGANPALGGGRGPHLHFELIPSGFIPNGTGGTSGISPDLNRVDPWPKIKTKYTAAPKVLDPNFTHTEDDEIVGDVAKGHHKFTDGITTGTFEWEATVTASSTAHHIFDGTVTITDDFGPRTASMKGTIDANAAGVANLNWSATDPVFGNIGWTTHASPPYQ